MLGSVFAPAAAHAAVPQWRHARLLQWAPAAMQRQVARGRHHEFPIVTHFRTDATIRDAAFTIRFDGGLYARPSAIQYGTVYGHMWHDLSFVVVAPSWVRVGWYHGVVRLVKWEGRHDYDRLGVPFNVWVRVVPRVSPPPAPRVTWAPATLAPISLSQGQTVTETATFSSSVALTNVQMRAELTNFALDHFISISIVSPLPASVAANTPVPVTFTVSAGPRAGLYNYRADLHVLASANGGAVLRRANDLDFMIDVVRAPITITWTPAALAPITLNQGQTVTATASFTSNVALDSAQVQASLHDVAVDHGISVTITSPIPTSVAANTVTPVTFAVSADPHAALRSYQADLHVLASVSGSLVVRQWHDLDFAIRVVRAASEIQWTPGFLGNIHLRQGQAVTITASFVSGAALTNAQLVGLVDEAIVAPGLTVAAVMPIPASVAAGTPISVSFAISAAPTTPVRFYHAHVYVLASVNGGQPVRQWHDLDFGVSVGRAA